MSLYDVLDQIVILLRQRKRLAYSLLKREFALDNETLEGLKDELIYAQQVARDENDKVIVWLGEGDTETEPIRVPSVQPETSPKTQLTAVETPPAKPHTPDAERRQLTVMFCDLVGSTSLSGQLDPEDLREVVQAYQATSTEVIQRFEGYVAQHLGDGILCYFGYPTAHEDDAQRAVKTGLGIIDAMKALNQNLEQNHGIQLAVRVSVHTGLVVVGGIGAGERQEQLALGEVPNVAARIQGLAEPDTVVISEVTHRLIEGYFDCEPLGERELRGVAEPIVVHRVLQESGTQSRLEIASTHGLTPLVGREQEVGLLLDRWARVKDGAGQVVLLSGEAGIGKSRLVQVLNDYVSADGSHTRLECRSSPYFTNSALYPIIDMVQRTLQFETGETPGQKLEKLEQHLRQFRLPLDETVPLFGVLLSLPVPEDRYPPLNLTPQRQRQKTLESIVAIILELAEPQPVLFIMEDGHWTDATTLELLDLLLDQTPTASLLILITYRPEFQTTWGNRSYLTQITLNRLSRNQVEQLAEQVAGGKGLPDEIIQQLVDKTDGVPLYIEEMTKSILESGILKVANRSYELSGPFSSLAIPATLQDSLMSRLDRLMTAKVIAQLGATIGRQFDYDLLCSVAQLDEPTLQRELGRLVEAELVYQRGLPPYATYTFKHALVQDTAYESLLRNTRQGYHRRIAEVLTKRFPETTENQPELLAHHYTQAGLTEQAISYWQRAGERASDRSSYPESISHLTTGLTLLQMLPETLERHHQELPLQIALGAASRIVKGHAAPEVEVVYKRARALCQQLGDTQDIFPVLFGLWLIYVVRANFPLARPLGEELLEVAEQKDQTPLYVMAHYALGCTCFWMGELLPAHRHLQEGRARDIPVQSRSAMFRSSQDPGVACRVYTAYTLWMLGYPDQALARAHEALALATELDHPFSNAFALYFVSIIYQLRRDEQEVYEHAEATRTLSSEQGFIFWLPASTILRGWVLTVRGQGEAGVTQMRQGLTDWHATGAETGTSYYWTLLVEGYKVLNQVEKGLSALKEGLEMMARTGEHSWKADVHRLQGELLLGQATPDVAQAETCFHQALDVARSQQAKSLELRAATSLAKLWQQQDKRQEAYDLLAPVYEWFTEGFDTADLKDAKRLLDELSIDKGDSR